MEGRPLCRPIILGTRRSASLQVENVVEARVATRKGLGIAAEDSRHYTQTGVQERHPGRTTPVISLRREGRRALNARMKMKLLLSLAVIGCFALSAALAQTPTPAMIDITGKVKVILDTSITVQKPDEPKWVWKIKKGPGTNTTITGDQKVGETVTVNCIETNAQKKEAPPN